MSPAELLQRILINVLMTEPTLKSPCRVRKAPPLLSGSDARQRREGERREGEERGGVGRRGEKREEKREVDDIKRLLKEND